MAGLRFILHRRGATTISSGYSSIVVQAGISRMRVGGSRCIMHRCGVKTAPSSYYSITAQMRFTGTIAAGLHCTMRRCVVTTTPFGYYSIAAQTRITWTVMARHHYILHRERATTILSSYCSITAQFRITRTILARIHHESHRRRAASTLWGALRMYSDRLSDHALIITASSFSLDSKICYFPLFTFFYLLSYIIGKLLWLTHYYAAFVCLVLTFIYVLTFPFTPEPSTLHNPRTTPDFISTALLIYPTYVFGHSCTGRMYISCSSSMRKAYLSVPLLTTSFLDNLSFSSLFVRVPS